MLYYLSQNELSQLTWYGSVFLNEGVCQMMKLMLPLPCRCGSERVSTLVCQKGPAGKKLKCPRRWLRYQLVLETCYGLCSGMGTCWCELA